MHARAVAERLCRRRRLCICSLADASQVSIPINGILHVRLNFTHTAFSKPPINGILRALWQRCRPINGKMKTTSSAFTDQSGMCWKQRSTLEHPCCRALINLFPPISRPKRPPSTRAGRLQTSLQGQLGRLHTTRRHRVTFLHWCVHSMAPNLNSEPSQPPSSFTVELQHGSSKLPRLVLQHCLRKSKQKLRNPKRISSLHMAELAALPP